MIVVGGLFVYAFSRIMNLLPFPNSLSTVSVPPCASTKSFEMESPSPLPCTFVRGTRKITVENALMITGIDTFAEILHIQFNKLLLSLAPITTRPFSFE